MMNSAMSNLLDRAERAGAALLICDEQDRIVRVNSAHLQIYDFADYSMQPTFEEFLWGSINSRKMANQSVYQDPHAWVQSVARYRQYCDYTQFITRHTDGKVMFVCYEKLRGAINWSYQARIDITLDVKARFSKDSALLGPACWDGTFSPMARNTTVPIGNVLDAMPAAAGLIMARGKLLDANKALLALLLEGDGLLRVNDRVAVRNHSEQDEFLKRLDCFFGPVKQRRPVTMRISRQESEEAYFLNVSPLLGQGRETWDNGHIGVLTVATPAVTPSIDPRMLMEFFGITFAEAEVAAALGAGHTIVGIAERRGVQVNTIHAQIKKIVEKTGYKGQADIARRVSDIARVFGRR